MLIDEFRPGRVLHKLGEQRGAVGWRHSGNVRRVVADIERLAAGLRVGAHQRVIDFRQSRVEGRAEHDPQSGEALLCVIGQRGVGQRRVGKLGIAAAPRSLGRHLDRV